MIKLRIFLTFFTASLLSISCGAIEVAFFDVDSSGGVYLHTPKILDRSDKITVLSDDQKKGCCLTFFGREFLKVNSSEQVSSDEDGRPVVRYKLSPQKSSVEFKTQVSAAIIGNIKLISTSKEKFKLLSSFKNYVIETCYGIEGRNLYLKHKGAQIGHLYYYFNIDIESTCK